MGRRLLLAAGGVVAVVVAAVVVAVVRSGDGEGAAPTTTSTSPSTTASTSSTEDPDAPVDLRFVPRPMATAAAARECLARPDVTVLDAEDGTLRLGGSDPPVLSTGMTIDARAVEWEIDKGDDPPTNPAPRGWSPDDSGFRYPIDIGWLEDEPRDDLCLLGGRISSPYPDSPGERRDARGWELLWHKTSAAIFYTETPTVVGTDFERTGDGVDFEGERSDGWSVLGVRMKEVHDDCVEADQRATGRLVDSLLDGCFSGVSASSPTRDEVPGATIEISASLIRLQAMQAGYKPDVYGRPNHGNFLKWDDRAATPVIEGSVLRADQLPIGGRFAFPPDTTCTDSTFVWGGDGPLPEQDVAFLRCFDDDGVEPLGERITTDVAVWDDAVAAWEAARPGFVTEPGASPP